MRAIAIHGKGVLKSFYQIPLLATKCIETLGKTRSMMHILRPSRQHSLFEVAKYILNLFFYYPCIACRKEYLSICIH